MFGHGNHMLSQHSPSPQHMHAHSDDYMSKSKGNQKGARRNPTGKDGKVMSCDICGSEWHFRKDCPQADKGRHVSTASPYRTHNPFVDSISGAASSLHLCTFVADHPQDESRLDANLNDVCTSPCVSAPAKAGDTYNVFRIESVHDSEEDNKSEDDAGKQRNHSMASQHVQSEAKGTRRIEKGKTGKINAWEHRADNRAQNLSVALSAYMPSKKTSDSLFFFFRYLVWDRTLMWPT